MTEPTKADLKAAVAKLTTENAGLRDLLAAASECAATVPVSADANWVAEWRRSSTVLTKIKVLCTLDGGWQGEIAYGARVLRECAAEPVGYEVRAEPEPAATVPAPNPPHHAFRTDERECTAEGYEDAVSGYVCTSQEGHDGPDHVAWNPGGGEYHRWPIADPAPVARDATDGQTYSDGPASVTA